MPANPLGVALRNRHAGHHTLVWARPDLQAPENFTLTSPAFDHGAPIPEKHRGRLFGANISPALNWTQPPAGTAELVLIVQDPDVPIGKPATHALTLGIDPSLNGIPENALTNPSPIPGTRTSIPWQTAWGQTAASAPWMGRRFCVRLAGTGFRPSVTVIRASGGKYFFPPPGRW